MDFKKLKSIFFLSLFLIDFTFLHFCFVKLIFILVKKNKPLFSLTPLNTFLNDFLTEFILKSNPFKIKKSFGIKTPFTPNLFCKKFTTKLKNILVPLMLRRIYLDCLTFIYFSIVPTLKVFLVDSSEVSVTFVFIVLWHIFTTIEFFWYVVSKLTSLLTKRIFFLIVFVIYVLQQVYVVKVHILNNTFVFFLKTFFLSFLNGVTPIIFLKLEPLTPVCLLSIRVGSRIWTYNLQCHKLTLYRWAIPT